MCYAWTAEINSHSGVPKLSCHLLSFLSHKLVFCRKVIALTKHSISILSKQKDKKKQRKKQEDSSSSSEDDKPTKKVKKVNATKDFMYDPHVYISTIDIDEMDLSEHPYLPLENLPVKMTSTVSTTNILEALGAPSYSRG